MVWNYLLENTIFEKKTRLSSQKENQVKLLKDQGVVP